MRTGRSPRDKRIVDHPDSHDNIWWGDVNVAVDEHTFEINRERAIDYLNTLNKIYVVDGFAGFRQRYGLEDDLYLAEPGWAEAITRSPAASSAHSSRVFSSSENSGSTIGT